MIFPLRIVQSGFQNRAGPSLQGIMDEQKQAAPKQAQAPKAPTTRKAKHSTSKPTSQS